MDWKEALEIAVEMTGNGRLRELTSDGNPSEETRRSYRNLVVSLATGRPIPTQRMADQMGRAEESAAIDSLIAQSKAWVKANPDPDNRPAIPVGRKCCGG